MLPHLRTNTPVQQAQASNRFRLAAAFRKKTDALVLMTATPHQGMQDKFKALLELLRPERKEEIETLDSHPELIGEMVFRNHKADVTDAEGRFIFKDKTTRAIPAEVSRAALEFDRLLQQYLRRGYSAGAAMGRTGLPGDRSDPRRDGIAVQ